MNRNLLAVFCIAVPLGASAVTLPPVLEGRDGRTVEVQQCRTAGKNLVLVFWQSWCGACKKEAPELVNVSHQFQDTAQFVGVVSGSDKVIDERRVDRFIQATGLDYPQVRDRDLTLTDTFQVKATPTIIVIDPEGHILYRGHHAPDDWKTLLGS